MVASLSFATSIATVYLTQLRPASLRLTLGQYMLVSKGPRLGIIGTLTNEGSRQAVITSAFLHWDRPQSDLRYEMLTSSIDQIEHWTEGEKTTNPTTYTIAVPISVRAHEQNTVSWVSA